MIQNVSSEFLAKIDRLAEIRRENIRNSVSDIAVTGTAYYVSADGCDDSDGKSPETAWKSTARVNREDLLPGDVLLCLEDSFGDVAYSAFFDGEKLIGCFEAGGKTRSISGEELDAFMDSLFGRFAFLLLRPAQGL